MWVLSGRPCRSCASSVRPWGDRVSDEGFACAGHWYDRALVTAAGCFLWACTTAAFGAAGSLGVRADALTPNAQ